MLTLNWVAAGLAAAMTLHVPPAAAGDREPLPPLGRWSAEAQASLKRALIEPRPIGKPAEPAGVVDVAFAIGKDGRTTRISILHPSGYRALDRKALAAVRRIRTRAEPPPALSGGQTAVARIFIAPGDRPLDDIGMRDIIERTAARNDWALLDRRADANRHMVVLAAAR